MTGNKPKSTSSFALFRRCASTFGSLASSPNPSSSSTTSLISSFQSICPDAVSESLAIMIETLSTRDDVARPFRDSALLPLANLVINVSKVSSIYSITKTPISNSILILGAKTLSASLSSSSDPDAVVATSFANAVGSAPLIQVLKSHPDIPLLAQFIARALARVAKVETKVGILARLHGGIDVSLKIVTMYAQDSNQVELVVAALHLLKVYCALSANNAEAVISKARLMIKALRPLSAWKVAKFAFALLKACEPKLQKITGDTVSQFVLDAADACLDMKDCDQKTLQLAVDVLKISRPPLSPVLYRLLDAFDDDEPSEPSESSEYKVLACDVVWSASISDLDIGKYQVAARDFNPHSKKYFDIVNFCSASGPPEPDKSETFDCFPEHNDEYAHPVKTPLKNFSRRPLRGGRSLARASPSAQVRRCCIIARPSCTTKKAQPFLKQSSLSCAASSSISLVSAAPTQLSGAKYFPLDPPGGKYAVKGLLDAPPRLLVRI